MGALNYIRLYRIKVKREKGERNHLSISCCIDEKPLLCHMQTNDQTYLSSYFVKFIMVLHFLL